MFLQNGGCQEKKFQGREKVGKKLLSNFFEILKLRFLGVFLIWDFFKIFLSRFWILHWYLSCHKDQKICQKYAKKISHFPELSKKISDFFRLKKSLDFFSCCCSIFPGFFLEKYFLHKNDIFQLLIWLFLFGDVFLTREYFSFAVLDFTWSLLKFFLLLILKLHLVFGNLVCGVLIQDMEFKVV